MMGCLMNNELEKIGKEPFVVDFRYCVGICWREENSDEPLWSEI
jgi:hypothetical protein